MHENAARKCKVVSTKNVNWDPDMRAARDLMELAAAKYPPVQVAEPLDDHRRVNDTLQLVWARGGPAMAMTEDLWVFAHGRRVLCRLHRPTAAGTLPALVWFHGGGWVWSSIDTHDRLVRELAAASGLAAISVDYALSPEARFPQALLECVGVLRRLAAEADGWGIDPARIVVGGDSAGGNLALAAALMLRDEGGPTLGGILAVYPVTELGADTASYRDFAEGYGLTAEAMRTYRDLYLRDPGDRTNPLAAPARADLASLPPTLIQLAELDVLRCDGEILAERMRAAGVDVTLETYPGVLHGFMRLSEAVGAARTGIASAGAWLRRVTGP
jgi:acetyl esterase